MRRYSSRLIGTFVLVAFAWFSRTVFAQPETTRHTVVGIYWSTEDFPVNAPIDAAIRAVLPSGSPVPVDYFAEYLETDRFPEEDASIGLRDYIRRKYSGRRIDAVIAIADPALRFVLGHREELFPVASIVYAGTRVEDQRPGDGAAGLTGIAAEIGYADNLKLVLQLHPSAEHVFVVARAPSFDLEKLIREELSTIPTQVPIDYIRADSVSQLLAAVRAVPARSVILFFRYSQEGPGNVLFPQDVARLVAGASPVPVYGGSGSYLGTGVVGGLVNVPRTLGTRLGEMARQILDGTRAQDIPIERARLVPVFDWRALERWSIDPSGLPDGSELRFKVPTSWELYRWYILAAISFIAIETLLIVSLVVQRARRNETEGRNAAILRAAPDMMFLLTRDGVYIDFHAPNESRFLMEPDQFLGRHIREVLPPGVVAAMENEIARLTPQQAPAIVEYTLQTPEGPCQYEARLVPCLHDQVLAVVRDITDRTRAQMALSDSRERYALATSAGGVSVWDWDLETNEVYADSSLKSLLGYQDDDIENGLDHWLRLVHPDDVRAIMDAVQNHLEGNNPYYEVEHRMVHRDGAIRWFLARGTAVRREGRSVRIIGTETDITERKTSERALLDTQAELARVSRLTALGEFAASVAHEVRQPLTAIMINAKTCLRLLGRATPDLKEVHAALLDVIEAGLRAEELIRRNRELFKDHTVQKTPLDLNDVVREVAVLARVRLQASHVMLATSLADLPDIYGDRVELQQVLLNLVANSIDAMDGLDPKRRILEISSSLESRDIVKVSVADSGIGLEGVDMERMFTLSYTTKPTGTGVGLSISRSIVEAHGGRLWAEPNAGRGATFSFTLPVHSTVEMTA